MGRDEKWDRRGIDAAFFFAKWSKDPSTQVGAVIMRPDRTIASMGFNGFPRGVEDDERLNIREQKYEHIIHAEMNAILTATEPVKGYTLCCSLMACTRCTVHVIQAGITRIVSPVPTNERWMESIKQSTRICEEVGVEVVFYDGFENHG